MHISPERREELENACSGLAVKLYDAFREKDADTVKRFIEKFNLQKYHELLTEAISSNNFSLVKAVVDAGCYFAPSCFYFAMIQKNDPQIPMYIFQLYLRPFKTESQKKRAIQVIDDARLPLSQSAIRRCDLDLIKCLDSIGFCLGCIPEDVIALLEKIDSGQCSIDVLEYFLEKGRMKPKQLIGYQVSERLLRDISIIELLLKYRIDPSYYLAHCVDSPFKSQCPLDVVKYLVARGAKPCLSSIVILAVKYQLDQLRVLLPIFESPNPSRDFLRKPLIEVLDYISQDCEGEIPRNREEHYRSIGSIYHTYFPIVGIGNTWSSDTLYEAMIGTCKLLVLYGAEIPQQRNPLLYLLTDFRRKIEFSLLYDRIRRVDHPLLAERDLVYAVSLFV